ncbi:MAG: hypothetical protein ACJAZ9_000770 [Neolewinella sp.]|jgi:hypothetical protein
MPRLGLTQFPESLPTAFKARISYGKYSPIDAETEERVTVGTVIGRYFSGCDVVNTLSGDFFSVKETVAEVLVRLKCSVTVEGNEVFHTY